MAGLDKLLLEDKLIALGWKPCKGKGFRVRIPDSLLDEAKGVVFHVYEARDIQNLLGDSIEEEE